uniref:Uncharacterized protein n=1 Tax=Anguilla anguilla TaxID=7936 RepID=A0A0E9VMA2_ANGAN
MNTFAVQQLLRIGS